MELDGAPVTVADGLPLGLYNYGHFTSMLVENLAVKGLHLHLERLARDCDTLFGVGLEVAEVRRRARRVADEASQPTVVRVTVFDPQLDLGAPGRSATPRVLLTSRSAGPTPPPPLRVTTTHYVRELPQVKHVGLFGTLHHRRQAQLAGHDDVLFTDGNGQISEGATWNVGFWDGARVYWPKADCLAGVAMRLVQEVLTDMGVPSSDAPFDVERVRGMQAAFATNAVVGVRPIRAINDIDIVADGVFLQRLQAAYAAILPTIL